MKITTQEKNRKYRPDIDGLRAIAICSVVFNHAGFTGFSGGFVGVDIFFVISGFLITSLLFNEVIATGHLSLGAFFARRVRRLMPAGLVVVASTLVLGGTFMLPGSNEMASLARSAVAVAFFSSNFFFYQNTGGYFDAPSFGLPLLHTWSLSIEEQYYLLWPLLMLLFIRFTGFSRHDEKARGRIISILAVMTFSSLALCITTTPDNQKFAFYLLPSRVWEFSIGGIIGLAGERFYSRLEKWGDLFSVTGLSLIGYAVFFFDHKTSFPGAAAMVPVFGTSFLIVGMTANRSGIVQRILSIKPIVAVGLLSYSWYLWHWPLLSIYRIHNLGVQDLQANAVLLIISLGLAWLTYIWIERPVRMHRPWVFNAVRPTLLAGFGISLVMILMSGSLLMWRSHQKSSDLYLMVKAGRDERPKACSVPFDKAFDRLPTKDCMHGPEGVNPQVILWGDSHAEDKAEMLVAALPNTGIYQLTSSGCVPVIGYEAQGMPGTTKICPQFNQRVLEEILERRKQGLTGVVISARWENYLWKRSISAADKEPGEKQIGPEELAVKFAAMRTNFEAMLTTLERAGLRVVVLAPTPSMIYDVPLCVGLGRGGGCNTPRAANELLLGDITAGLAKIVSRHPNTRLVQVMDYFCDEQTCHAYRDNQLLYFDDDHITTSAARGLGRFLSSNLEWLLGINPVIQ